MAFYVSFPALGIGSVARVLFRSNWFIRLFGERGDWLELATSRWDTSVSVLDWLQQQRQQQLYFTLFCNYLHGAYILKKKNQGTGNPKWYSPFLSCLTSPSPMLAVLLKHFALCSWWKSWSIFPVNKSLSSCWNVSILQFRCKINALYLLDVYLSTGKLNFPLFELWDMLGLFHLLSVHSESHRLDSLANSIEFHFFYFFVL